MTREVIYRDEQVNQLSSNLNLPKTVITGILKEYSCYIKERLMAGYTVKFLNVCYIRVNGESEKEHETLAYVATEIAGRVGVSNDIAYRVLSAFEEYMIRDLRKFYGYCIKGIIRIRLEQTSEGVYKVRTKKSTRYNGLPITVTTLGSFRRKAEITA